MASKVNLKNVGWRALIERIEALPGFPARPNGAPATVTTLDTIAAGYNELVDDVAAVKEAVASIPFPWRASS